MLNAPARAAFALVAALACGAGARPALAQAAAPREAPATVEGRVTDGEKGLPGVAVTLVAADASNGRVRAAARAKTDQEGRYRLTGARPGGYHVLPMAPAYVLPGSQSYPPGRRITLAAGETVEDVDFRLTRGGVITGRVADADGRPVVAEPVHVTPADRSQPEGRSFQFPQRILTDDRGVYRAYGLAPGRYRVSAGQDAEGGAVRMGASRRYYRRTFYPDAAEESQGRVVEVTPGGEAEDVDITLGRAAKTYRAAGRFVGPDGRPAPGVSFGYGRVEHEGVNMFGGGMLTNSRGEFQVDGLAPGRYAVFAISVNDTQSETYSDSATFEVGDADVSGLEVKLRRGAAVSGVVQIEGTSDRATVARLMRQIRLHGETETVGAPAAPNYAQAPVGADGGFRLTGLRPGRLRIGLGWPQVRGLVLARVELSGVEQRDGIEIGEGAQVSGARVVVVYGNSVVRGQINITNGSPGPDARLVVFARRTGGGAEARYGGFGQGAEVDARGRFIMEGLAAGDYEFTARVFTRQGQRHQSQRAHVNVPEGGEASVTLTLDLGVVNDK